MNPREDGIDYEAHCKAMRQIGIEPSPKDQWEKEKAEYLAGHD
jgi:hypothetical protein